MTDILPRTDEDFVRDLRERIDASAPDVRVDTTRVVPAARRTRRRRRATALVAGVTLVGVGVGWATQPWADQAPEIAPATAPPSTLPEDSPAPADGAPAPADDASALGPGWPDAPYWHVRSENHETESNGTEHVYVVDEWFGNDRPGLLVFNDNLASAAGIRPQPFGWSETLLVEGEQVELGWDTFFALPTDPAELEAVLRDNLTVFLPDAGTREDDVLRLAVHLLASTPAPPTVRDALWTVATNQPTATTLGEVADTRGRDGVGLESVTTHGGDDTGPAYTLAERYVYDPVGHRLLEVSSRTFDGHHEDVADLPVQLFGRETYLEDGPADVLPADPPLAGSGCDSWETC